MCLAGQGGRGRPSRHGPCLHRCTVSGRATAGYTGELSILPYQVELGAHDLLRTMLSTLDRDLGVWEKAVTGGMDWCAKRVQGRFHRTRSNMLSTLFWFENHHEVNERKASL